MLRLTATFDVALSGYLSVTRPTQVVKQNPLRPFGNLYTNPMEGNAFKFSMLRNYS